MARINVEQAALTDSRYVRFARLAGLADAHHARGMMLLVWNECQERETYTLHGDELEDIFGISEVGPIMVEAKLAAKVKGGKYRIKGTKGRIEWLKNRRMDGKRGGRPPKPYGKPKGKPNASTSDNPPAPAPAPAPAEKSKTPLPPVSPNGDTDTPRPPTPASGGSDRQKPDPPEPRGARSQRRGELTPRAKLTADRVAFHKANGADNPIQAAFSELYDRHGKLRPEWEKQLPP